jgi:mRNA-degrading endonuclease RelE of RelBE toxin-antitoxin system
MANNSPVIVRFAAEFEKELYRLSRKYRNVRRDVEPIIEQLREGRLLGDRISGFTSNVYISKVRIKNSNIQKGSQ